MMPTWLLLAVFGGLATGVVLAMVIGFQMLEKSAMRQCVHTKQKQQQPQSQTGISGEGAQHLCCSCHSLHNHRVQHSPTSNPKFSLNPLSEVAKLSELLHPLVEAACNKIQAKSSNCQITTMQANGHSSIVTGLQRGWINARKIFRGVEKGVKADDSRKEDDSGIADKAVATAAADSEGSNAAPIASDSASMTTITTTITTTTSTSFIDGSPSASGGGGSNEGAMKSPPPQRRLVLEILMSPSGDGQVGSFPRATGVRLKLETNGSLDSLTSLAAAASSDSTQNGDAEIWTGNEVILYPHMQAGNLLILTKHSQSAPFVYNGTSENSTRSASGTTKSGSLVARQGANQAGASLQKEEAMSAGMQQGLDMGMNSNKGAMRGGQYEELDCLHLGGIAKVASGSSMAQKGSGLASTIAVPVSRNPAKSKVNGHLTGALGSKGKAKGASSPGGATNGLNGLAVLSNIPTTYALNSTGQGLPTARNLGNHHAPSNLALDGLGSLRISLLEAGTKGKSMKECTKGLTTDIASALAALNIESIGGKGVGMGARLASGVMLTEAPGKGGTLESPCSKAVFDFLLEEEGQGEGSGSEQGVEEGDENQGGVLKGGQECDEEDTDGKKKEKKKKKNRGRRHKAKAAAAAAAACGDALVNQREAEKVAPERNEPNFGALSSEVEVGCICGTPKGGSHNSNCPYPFTSSGSMIQRKIKEQYDELVRSNVAKTLTLAQVGRFTTCLVEAKSALQQKSDTIQRKFTISKSLLAKADKSSFDRLCGQIYGLEIEQKKLEEDTVVYNRLQEQLKLSPAYLKMLEYGRTHFELQPNTGQLIEKLDAEDIEISFEELLAQEKKDSYWQKHGPARSSVQVS